MDSLRRADIFQKLIKLIKSLKELGKPEWFMADKIMKEIIEPELKETKRQYETLFLSDNDSDKH